MRIAVIGLGKLGAPLAAVLAEAGHDVIGVDQRAEVVASVNDGIAPVREPRLAALIQRNRARLRAITDPAAAASASDATFVLVPTPTESGGTFSSAFVVAAVEAAATGLRGSSRYHVVAITSTVTPGSMAGEVRPALERASGRAMGASIGLCYNPEFVALGQVIDGMTRPDFVLIGESDARAGTTLAAIQRSVVGMSVPIEHMTFINAEITKLAVNGYVTTKISYANMLAGLCERIPGGDVEVVTAALGLDGRIGPPYLRGAMGYGGPCLPRDNHALMAVAARCGARADLAAATEALNRHQGERLLQAVERHRTPGRERVGILGLAYKAGTPVVDASQGIMLANRLAATGAAVTVYDPQALPDAAAHLHRDVSVAESAERCVASSDIVVVTTPWPEFARIPSPFAPRRDRYVVIDCWRILDPEHTRESADLVYPGRMLEPGPIEASAAVMRSAAC
jgi:UDPglucose 6-dehydrogenase